MIRISGPKKGQVTITQGPLQFTRSPLILHGQQIKKEWRGGKACVMCDKSFIANLDGKVMVNPVIYGSIILKQNIETRLQNMNWTKLREILDFHSGDYKEYYRLGCEVWRCYAGMYCLSRQGGSVRWESVKHVPSGVNYWDELGNASAQYGVKVFH